MEKLSFDTGVKQYRLGNGILRFNPGDPNVYARFLEAEDKVGQIEARLSEQAKKIPQGEGMEAVKLMREADCQMKQLLNTVFGAGNDFDEMLGGVNLLAVTGNGNRVITNLFAALEPILVAGAERCATQVAEEAAARAQRRRADGV